MKDNLGELYRDWGRDEDARAQFVAILAAAEANQWDERLATANGDLGDLAAKAGDDAAARRYYEAGLAHAYRIKRANTIAPCSLGLSRTLHRQGEIAKAYDHLREAERIYHRLGAEDIVVTIETELAELAAELAMSGDARRGEGRVSTDTAVARRLALDFVARSRELLHPYLVSSRFSTELATMVGHHGADNDAYRVDTMIDELLVDLLVEHRIGGRVFSEESGWRRTGDTDDYRGVRPVRQQFPQHSRVP